MSSALQQFHKRQAQTYLTLLQEVLFCDNLTKMNNPSCNANESGLKYTMKPFWGALSFVSELSYKLKVSTNKH